MKIYFSNSPIGRLRFVGIAEGISFLLLMMIAMPLKYLAHFPEPVKIVGWIHGLLFILYIGVLMHASLSLQWSFRRVLIAFVASLVPAGTFILDRQLRKEEESIRNK